MKIVIVTVYKSHNFGSYLQAKQLSKILDEYGEVSFLDSGTRKPWKLFVRKAKRTIKRRVRFNDIFRGPLFEFGEWRRIRNCWRSMPSRKNCDQTDVMVLGSDEIWDVKRPECRHPVYWGGTCDAYKISYAPSVSIAQKEDFDRYPEYVEYLNRIDRLSVRDIHSRDVIGALADKKIELVLDPTLLWDAEPYGFRHGKPYIAVYLFEGSLQEDERKAIIEFARGNSLDLVSAGQYINWCDRCVHSINGNPFYIFENAKYVVTNTFHGTAYAINYRRQFVAYASRKPKVVAMLTQFGLENRIVSGSKDIKALLGTEIEYNAVYRRILESRENSLKYIRDAVEAFENGEGK